MIFPLLIISLEGVSWVVSSSGSCPLSAFLKLRRRRK